MLHWLNIACSTIQAKQMILREKKDSRRSLLTVADYMNGCSSCKIMYRQMINKTVLSHDMWHHYNDIMIEI